MLAKLKKLINRSKIVSFDIFDTLLLRPYVKPSDVFEDIEQIYSVPGFRLSRQNAEAKAWQDLVNEDKDDVNLDEIYKYIPKKFQSIKDKEIEFEESCLHANPEMLEIFNYALSLNKQIIITSDMYLPSKVLKKILSRELKTDKFKLYVSCECGKRKDTGKLFSHILQDLSVQPKDILHIGDNKISDYKKPRQYGLKAFHYICPMKKYLSNNRTKEFLKTHDNLQTRRFIGTLALMCEIYKDSCDRDYWDMFAFVYGGALAYNYIKMISDVSKKENLSDLFFVARDGYSLEKIFNIMEPKSDIKTKYVYAPRFTNTLSYIDFGSSGVISERKKVLLDFLVAQGVAKPNDKIDQHIDTLQRYAEQERKEYQNYISKLNSGKRIGIIDSISMSFSAQKLITKNLQNCETVGFYWWVVPDDKQTRPAFYQFYNGKKWPDFCHLIEFCFAAPEKPIHRVMQGKPIYKEHIDKYEQIKIDLYPKISAAMLDFAKTAKKYNLNPIISDDAMFDWMDGFIKFANGTDYRHFKNIKNGTDQSHTKYVSVLPRPGDIKIRKFFRETGHVFFRIKKTDSVKKIYVLGINIAKINQ